MNSLTASKAARVFANGNRYYKFEGDEFLYPSVTSILKIANQPSLNYWMREKEYKAIKEHLHQNVEAPVTPEIIDAALEKGRQIVTVADPSSQFGNEAHELIESILLSGEDVECAPHLVHVKSSFMRWLNREKEIRKFQVLATELSLYSKTHKYAGSADAVARVFIRGEPKTIVLDWKTSNSLRNHYALQIAAYSKLYEENFNEAIYAGIVIRFSKTSAEYEVRTVKNLDKIFANFVNYKAVWELEQKDVNLFDQIRISPAEE